MCGKGMPKSVTAHALGDAGGAGRLTDRSLHGALVKMMAAMDAAVADERSGRGEHVTPLPVLAGIRILPQQRGAESRRLNPGAPISEMSLLRLLKLLMQGLD